MSEYNKIDAHGISNEHLNSAIYCGKNIFVLATPRWDSMKDLDHPIFTNGPDELVKRCKEFEDKNQESDGTTRFSEYLDIKKEFNQFAINKNRFAKACNFFASLSEFLSGDGFARCGYEGLFESGIEYRYNRNEIEHLELLIQNKEIEELAIKLLKTKGIQNSEEIYNSHKKNLSLKDSLFEKNDFNYETEAILSCITNEGIWIENGGSNYAIRVRNGEAEDLTDKIRQQDSESTKSMLSIPDRFYDFNTRGILGFHNDCASHIPSAQFDIKKNDVYIFAANFLKPLKTRDNWGYIIGSVGLDETHFSYAVEQEKSSKDIAEFISEMELSSYTKFMTREQDIAEAKADWKKYRKPLVVIKFEGE